MVYFVYLLDHSDIIYDLLIKHSNVKGHWKVMINIAY
jgi:hypothetical protein